MCVCVRVCAFVCAAITLTLPAAAACCCYLLLLLPAAAARCCCCGNSGPTKTSSKASWCQQRFWRISLGTLRQNWNDTAIKLVLLTKVANYSTSPNVAPLLPHFCPNVAPMLAHCCSNVVHCCPQRPQFVPSPARHMDASIVQLVRAYG